MPRVWALLLLMTVSRGVAGQEEPPSVEEVYRKARGSVVAIRAMAPLGERSGSGVVIDDRGTILTSYSTCPEGSTRIRVWTAGPRMYGTDADEVTLLGASDRDEIAVLRIPLREGETIAPVVLGKASDLSLGATLYTLGNAANSLINDDQPSFSIGILSASYVLRELRAGSSYRGRLLETTAAVNTGMEGAPLLDVQGRMVGFVTLNYSPHRFLGCAIPVEEVRAAIDLLKNSDPAGGDSDVGGEAYWGFETADDRGRVRIASVDAGGPAENAGLRAGDVIVAIGEKSVTTSAEFQAQIKGLKPGAVVWLKIEAEGAVDQVKLEIGRKP